MFVRLIVIACLLSMLPSLAGAGEVGVLLAPQPAPQAAVAAPAVNLMPAQATEARILVAANELQSAPAEEQRPRKTHSGLTFREFVDVHFGDYRWVYWAIAGGILVAIHAN